VLKAGLLATLTGDAIRGLPVGRRQVHVVDELTGYVVRDRAFRAVVEGEIVGDGNLLGAVGHAILAGGAGDDDIGVDDPAHLLDYLVFFFGGQLDEIMAKKAILKVCVKGYRNKPLTKAQMKRNRSLSRKRVRVEHVFAHMTMSMGGMVVRCVGIIRAEANIILKNLAYNIKRYCALVDA
jgi:hypothetical protein